MTSDNGNSLTKCSLHTERWAGCIVRGQRFEDVRLYLDLLKRMPEVHLHALAFVHMHQQQSLETSATLAADFFTITLKFKVLKTANELKKSAELLNVSWDFEKPVEADYLLCELQATLVKAAMLAGLSKTGAEPDVTNSNVVKDSLKLLAQQMVSSTLSYVWQYVLIADLAQLLLTRTDPAIFEQALVTLARFYHDVRPGDSDIVEKKLTNTHFLDTISEVISGLRSDQDGRRASVIAWRDGLQITEETHKETQLRRTEHEDYPEETSLSFVKPAQRQGSFRSKQGQENLLPSHQEVIPLIGEGAVVEQGIDVQQCYQGIRLRGGAEDILHMLHDDKMNGMLEEELSNARSVISRQIVGKGAVVRGRLRVDQEGVAPIVDIRQSAPMSSTSTNANNIGPASFSLPDRLQTLIKDALSPPKSCRFNLTRQGWGQIEICYQTAREVNPIKIGRTLARLEDGLQEAIATSSLNATVVSVDEKTLTIIGNKQEIELLLNALCSQSGIIIPSVLKKNTTFFRPETPTSVDEPSTLACFTQ